MSSLSKYGKVFCVLYKQDSGCICFGVKNEKEKLFIKFAGAKPMRYNGTSEDAILTLKATCKVYEDLRLRNLISFINGENIENGYVTIFKSTDAECMELCKEKMTINIYMRD